jgi:SecD/SecF fusion protein
VSSIREFALPLMVGLISGTYSSIFIAANLWYIMKLHLGKTKLVVKDGKKDAKAA